MTKKKLTEAEELAGDELDLLLDRETILLGANEAGGKSTSAALLIQDGLDLDFNVVVIDFDRGLTKEIKRIFGKQPDNLEYFRASTWQRVDDGIKYAFAYLGPGDWVVLEMMNSMWELSQDEYTQQVYGGDVSKHLIQLRADTEREIEELQAAGKIIKDGTKKDGKTSKASERAKSVSYSGLEGRTDWFPIKRMHNMDVRDRLLMRGDFNVLGTTSMTGISKNEAEKWAQFANLGVRPEGEKNNVYKFDTIVITRKEDKNFVWRTDLGNGKGKDRGGRQLYRGVNCTNIGVVSSYFDTHDLSLGGE